MEERKETILITMRRWWFTVMPARWWTRHNLQRWLMEWFVPHMCRNATIVVLLLLSFEHAINARHGSSGISKISISSFCFLTIISIYRPPFSFIEPHFWLQEKWRIEQLEVELTKQYFEQKDKKKPKKGKKELALKLCVHQEESINIVKTWFFF